MGKCVGERQQSRALAARALPDYGLTFGAADGEMSGGL